ncbi:hypothetical protein ABW20_dc0103693 [Dactylellina cionopaga]|nr:hypothetical protein ABW20_dc0103693 [Dactylellina cionopaga]
MSPRFAKAISAPVKLAFSKLIPRGKKRRRQANAKEVGKPAINLPAEILEQILLDLPAIELLTTCRQVCKTWKILIETSSPLRYYSTTGLRFCDRHKVDPFHVSPMALEVLRQLWKKFGLAFEPNTKPPSPRFISLLVKSSRSLINILKRMISRFLDLIFDPSDHKILTFLKWIPKAPVLLLCVCYLAVSKILGLVEMVLMKYNCYPPPLREVLAKRRMFFKRAKMRNNARKLSKEFESVMNTVPFITKHEGYTVNIKAVTNFRFHNRFFRNFDTSLLDGESRKPLPDIYSTFIRRLASAAYEYNCLPARVEGMSTSRFHKPITNPAVLFLLQYQKKKGEETLMKRQTVNFGLWTESSVDVGNTQQYDKHHYRTTRLVTGYTYSGDSKGEDLIF